jgi:hypothetical protein
MANDVFKCDEQEIFEPCEVYITPSKTPIHKKIFHPTYMCFKHTTSMCKKYEPMKKQFSHNFPSTNCGMGSF